MGKDIFMSDVAFLLIVLATVLNGIAAGATLDQAIKQLPTRHRIGVIAYSTYSKAADLGNGLPWYISLGVSAVVLTIGAATVIALQQRPTSTTIPLYLAVVLSIGHSLVTSQAAPTLFSQRQHDNDQAALTKIFTRFPRLNALRAALQVLTFATLLWALLSFER
jgi:branched-subunit amino acid ABC-type transport system permease component